jgi:uncharacterized repeat protein (TIGR03803 family)
VPRAGVIADGSGNLFGTTACGGGENCSSGCGSIFKWAADGTFSLLHIFGGVQVLDGALPQAELTLNKRGNLYGTTLAGGGIKGTCTHIAEGCGTVFELKSDGSYKVLVAFQKDGDGAQPQGALLLTNGLLYGPLG